MIMVQNTMFLSEDYLMGIFKTWIYSWRTCLKREAMPIRIAYSIVTMKILDLVKKGLVKEVNTLVFIDRKSRSTNVSRKKPFQAQ